MIMSISDANVAILLKISAVICAVNAIQSPPPWETEDAAFWKTEGERELNRALNLKWNENKAKNVIIFLGDGMGMTTITPTRILKGQLKGKTGEEESLAMDTFPHVGISKTYNTDRQTSDSAGTATAFLTGVKTRYGLLGLDTNAVRYNCSSEKGNSVQSILDYALEEGKSVGLVTTARITHATPGAAYAHTADRDWESDFDMLEVNDTDACVDIARQLVEQNPNINVLLGSGRRGFYGVNETAEWDIGNGTTEGNRLDGKNLIEVWKTEKEMRSIKHSFVWKKDQFDAVDPDTTDYLLGLFGEENMEYEVLRNKGPDGEPSLTEMTEKAIKILEKNANGFFLLVESGRIDHAHHDNLAVKAIYDTLEFDNAIQKSMDLVDEADTLIVVTADHSHVFTMAGSPSRGNPIFAIVDHPPTDPIIDGKPITTLGYFNGPGINITDMMVNGRPDLTNVDTADPEYVFQSAAPLVSETHGGEDVAIFARGPMAHLFHGVHEQSYIMYAMAYASCLGDNKKHCDAKPSSTGTTATLIPNLTLMTVLLIKCVI